MRVGRGSNVCDRSCIEGDRWQLHRWRMPAMLQNHFSDRFCVSQKFAHFSYDVKNKHWFLKNTSRCHRRKTKTVSNIETPHLITEFLLREKWWTSRVVLSKQIQESISNEHSCSSLRVFFSILAHLAQSFFSDFKSDKWIDVLILVWACKYKKACQWA